MAKPYAYLILMQPPEKANQNMKPGQRDPEPRDPWFHAVSNEDDAIQFISTGVKAFRGTIVKVLRVDAQGRCHTVGPALYEGRLRLLALEDLPGDDVEETPDPSPGLLGFPSSACRRYLT